MDGYMFKTPAGLPYFYHDRMDEIAVRCDPILCDRFHSFRWDHRCDCFFHYKFALGDIVQVRFERARARLEEKKIRANSQIISLFLLRFARKFFASFRSI